MQKGDDPKYKAGWKPKGRVGSALGYKLLDKHKEELYQIFELMDDGSGFIKLRDVQLLFKAMNFILEESDVKKLFKGVRPDKITVDVLVNIMENKMAEEEDRTDLKRIFSSFDHDNKGFITLDNLKVLAGTLELELNDEELEEMIYEADKNSDGVVTLDEFTEIMYKVNF